MNLEGNTCSGIKKTYFFLRQNDYENFLPTLLINGATQRQCALAVRAFNVEVAKIADVVSVFLLNLDDMINEFVSLYRQVSDNKIGQMRMKFWHDALDKIYDKKKEKVLPEHPVIRELNYVSLSIF